jgi:hypothetical protein
MLKETDIQYLLFFFNNAIVPISEHYQLEKRFEREFRTKISPNFKVDFGGNNAPISSSSSSSSSSSRSSGAVSSKVSSSGPEDDTVRDMPIISEDDVNKVKKYYENLGKDIDSLSLNDVIQRLKIIGSLSED